MRYVISRNSDQRITEDWNNTMLGTMSHLNEDGKYFYLDAIANLQVKCFYKESRY